MNIDSRDFQLTRDGITIEKRTMQRGRSRGVEVVELKKARSSVSLLPTRGSGVLQAAFDGIPLFWKSPVPPVHPAFIHLLRNEGLGWLDGFCEGIARCGIEHFGNPMEETITNNQGQSMTVFRPLHGEIGQIPAEDISLEIEGSDVGLFKSTLSFASVFGSKYAVNTLLKIDFSDRSLLIKDEVINRSRERELPVKLCYHINFGRPLLDEDAELMATSPSQTIPMSPRAEAGLKASRRFGPPEKMFAEHCFLMSYSSETRPVKLLLLNRKMKAAAGLSFSSRDFPCLVEWKQLGLDEYALGLEPATCVPPSMWKGRVPRDIPVLSPGSSGSFSFQVRLLNEDGEIEKAVRDIRGDGS